jgi:hypothetical protein
MAVTEEPAYLQPAAHRIDGAIRRASQPLIIDDIDDPRSVYVGVSFRAEHMAVPPITEGSGHFQVAEVVVGYVLINLGQPAQTDWRERHRAKAQQNARAASSRAGNLSAFRGMQLQAVEAGMLPGWHESQQIPRVSDEGEDLL